jgi:hypothetical protein
MEIVYEVGTVIGAARLPDGLVIRLRRIKGGYEVSHDGRRYFQTDKFWKACELFERQTDKLK